MGQITKAFCEQMLVHAARKEHAPLTIWEEEQLARAWLDLHAVGSVINPIILCAICSVVIYDDAAKTGYCTDHKPATARTSSAGSEG